MHGILARPNIEPSCPKQSLNNQVLTFHHNPPTTINICCLRRAPGKAAVVAVDVGSSIAFVGTRSRLLTLPTRSWKRREPRAAQLRPWLRPSPQPTMLLNRNDTSIGYVFVIPVIFLTCGPSALPSLFAQTSQSTPCVVYFASTASDGGESSVGGRWSRTRIGTVVLLG